MDEFISLECRECKMKFDTSTLLANHKRKFCVGSKAFDPGMLALEKGKVLADAPLKLPGKWAETDLASMSLEQLKNKLDNKLGAIDQLQERYASKQEQDIIDNITKLKAHRKKIRMDKELEEKQLMDKIGELQEKKTKELKNVIEKEEAKKRLTGLDKASIKSLEKAKARELDHLQREKELLLAKEKQALEEIAKLDARIRDQEQYNAQYAGNDPDRMRTKQLINEGREKMVEGKNILAREHGEKMAKIEELKLRLDNERKQVRERIAKLEKETGKTIKGGDDALSESQLRELVFKLKEDQERNEAKLSILKKKVHMAEIEDLESLSKESAQTESLQPVGFEKRGALKMDERGFIDLDFASNDKDKYTNALRDLQFQKMTEVEEPVKEVKKEIKFDPNNYPLPSSTDNPLLREIFEIRHEYIRKGGSSEKKMSEIDNMEREVRNMIAENEKASTSAPNTSQSFAGLPQMEGGIAGGINLPNLAQGSLPAYNMGGIPQTVGVPGMVQQQLLSYELENRKLESQIAQLSSEYHRKKMCDRLNEIGYLDDKIDQETGQRGYVFDIGDKDFINPDKDKEIYQLKLQHTKKILALKYEREKLLYQNELENLKKGLGQVSLQKVSADADIEKAPYDAERGFVIYWDFLFSPPKSFNNCSIAFGVFHEGAAKTPVVSTGSAEFEFDPILNSNIFQFARSKSYQRIFANSTTDIVVEGQLPKTADHDQMSMGWAKIDLFDYKGRLLAGKWKIPFHEPPVNPNMTSSDIASRTPKLDGIELYVRIVDASLKDVQDRVVVDATESKKYEYQKKEYEELEKKFQYAPYGMYREPSKLEKGESKAEERKTESPSQLSEKSVKSRLSSIASSGRVIRPKTRDLLDNICLGLRIERAKDIVEQALKINATVYQQNGKIGVNSNDEELIWSTEYKQQTLQLGVIEYDEQFVFEDMHVSSSTSIVLEVVTEDEDHNEIEVCWGRIPAMVVDHTKNDWIINYGRQKITLYFPPIVHSVDAKNLEAFGNGCVSVDIFDPSNPPRRIYSASSIGSQEQFCPCPPGAWQEKERSVPNSLRYDGSGFDFYIDGARFLPDNVSISKVSARILDSDFNKYGEDMQADIELDSNIYFPHYSYRYELRDTNLPSTALIMIKIHTIDLFDKNLCILGHALLNVFVEPGTEVVPTDKDNEDVSINEGNYQLSIYSGLPDTESNLSMDSFRCNRKVPGASLLVRLIRAPKSETGAPLKSVNVMQSDWEKKGLWVPPPDYATGNYLTMYHTPTNGEFAIFKQYLERKGVIARSILSAIGDGKERLLKTDKTISSWIKTKLTKKVSSEISPDCSLTYVCKYKPQYGFKVAVDGAKNLSKGRPTFAIYGLNPPASYYEPEASLQGVFFSKKLDFDSFLKAPTWTDGFRSFNRRLFNEFLALIIDLRAVDEAHVAVSGANTNKSKSKLIEQGWAVLQVFTPSGYVDTGYYQLPVFQGTPPRDVLKSMQKLSVRQTVERSLRDKRIKLMEGASVFVRIADGRRYDELGAGMVNPSQTYLDGKKLSKYNNSQSSKKITTIIPKKAVADEFEIALLSHFEQLAQLT
eukprot:Nk52_evm62s215 gene=Nk52_evmTU62s215